MFKNLPLYASGPITLGGALMSAFAGQLPPALQNIGLWLGVLLVFGGLASTLWHFGVQHKFSPRLRKEPLTLKNPRITRRQTDDLLSDLWQDALIDLHNNTETRLDGIRLNLIEAENIETNEIISINRDLISLNGSAETLNPSDTKAFLVLSHFDEFHLWNEKYTLERYGYVKYNPEKVGPTKTGHFNFSGNFVFGNPYILRLAYSAENCPRRVAEFRVELEGENNKFTFERLPDES